MGVMMATKPITGEELLALGDIGPSELIDGRIVTMTPTGSEHGLIESNLTTELRFLLRQRRLGWVAAVSYTHLTMPTINPV